MKRQGNKIDKQGETVIDNPLEIFNTQEIRSKQKSLSIKYRHCLEINELKFFQKLKYRQNIYELGHYVQIYDRTQKNPYVGKITKIIKLPDEHSILPFFEVQWQLRKYHITNKTYEKFQPYFSEAQVFPSDQLQYVYVESIMGPCFVLSNQEYQELDSTAQNIYFWRSKFDKKTKKLNPQPSQWATQCICETPVNPDLEYLQCSKCEKWFHSQCVQIDKSKILDQDYNCKKCLGSK